MGEFSQLWKEELPEEETERLITKIATEVCKRKLQTPAILMLEMNKPLAPIASQAAIIGAPFAIPFMGFDAFNDFTRLASKRGNVERLISKIEELSMTLRMGAD